MYEGDSLESKKLLKVDKIQVRKAGCSSDTAPYTRLGSNYCIWLFLRC